MKEYGCFNPYVILLHFLVVIAVCMFVMHPVILIISLLFATAYSFVLDGTARTIKKLFMLLPIAVITALVNPLFNHQGETVLWYFPSGNPLTKEAILFGVFSGVMLLSVIMWFSCFNKVFKSDKIMYVFGKIAPSLSLVCTMALRFVPELTKRAGDVIRAQRSLGNDIEKGGIKARLALASGVLSSVVGWSMESSIETAQSMKARGFGYRKRTAYSRYGFDKSDGVFLIISLICTVILASLMSGCPHSYYPGFVFSVDYYLFGAYALLCAMPVIVDIMEVRRWR